MKILVSRGPSPTPDFPYLATLLETSQLVLVGCSRMIVLEDDLSTSYPKGYFFLKEDCWPEHTPLPPSVKVTLEND